MTKEEASKSFLALKGVERTLLRQRLNTLGESIHNDICLSLQSVQRALDKLEKIIDNN
tara:strand:- start:3137 stop:3310 length:174 start_codon:yes stop_codon:yes gene_type:complete